MIQQSAEEGLAFELLWRCRCVGVLISQRYVVSDALMRAAGVVMLLDFLDDAFQMGLTDQYQVVARFACFADEPLCIGVAIRRLERRLDDLYPLGLEDSVEAVERRVVVMDEILYPGVIRVFGDEEISGLLADPPGIRIRCASGDLDPARLVMDEEHHVHRRQPERRPDFLGEEIRCPGHIEVTSDKRFPVHTLTVGRSRQAMFPQDITDGSGGNGISEFGHFARDPVVAPPIIAAQFGDDRLGVPGGRRPAGSGVTAF